MVIETDDGDTINVVIEGTLKAEGNAIEIKTPDAYDDSNLNITAWKIESGNNGALVAANGGDNASDAQKAVAEKVEKSINYILRIDENSASNVSFTGNNITKIGDLDTAHAGANVAIQLKTPDGFRVKNLYGDKPNNVKLEEGNDGNYYLVVPSGGGVWVSLELEKIPDPVTPVDPVDPVDPVNPVVPSEPSDNDDSSADHSYLDSSIRINTLSDGDMSFDEKEGILTITIPKGMNAFYLDSSVLLAFKAKGLKILNLDTTSGKYSIPLTSIDDIVKEGNLLAFVIRIEKVDIYINGLLTREFYRDKIA